MDHSVDVQGPNGKSSGGRPQPSLDAVAVDQGAELEAGPQTGWEAELTTGLVTELATADEPRFS